MYALLRQQGNLQSIQVHSDGADCLLYRAPDTGRKRISHLQLALHTTIVTVILHLHDILLGKEFASNQKHHLDYIPGDISHTIGVDYSNLRSIFLVLRRRLMYRDDRRLRHLHLQVRGCRGQVEVYCYRCIHWTDQLLYPKDMLSGVLFKTLRSQGNLRLAACSGKKNGERKRQIRNY